MNVMNIVRIAKVIALVAFVLPWVAVSCQGVDAATASGLDLAMGKMTPNPQFAEQMGQQGNSDSMGINYFAIGFAAVVVIGLLLTFVASGAAAARTAIATSVVGIALVFASVWWFKDTAKRDMDSQNAGMDGAAASSPFGGAGSPFGGAGASPFGPGSNPEAMGQAMLDSIIQERYGYWLAMGALAVAAGAGALGMAGRRDSAPPA